MGRTDRVESCAEQTGSNHGPNRQGRIMVRTNRVESWAEQTGSNHESNTVE